MMTSTGLCSTTGISRHLCWCDPCRELAELRAEKARLVVAKEPDRDKEPLLMALEHRIRQLVTA